MTIAVSLNKGMVKIMVLYDTEREEDYLLDGKYAIKAGGDMVKVVRCKDCKHWYHAICLKRNGGDGGDWYCADGEKQ